MQNKGMRNRYNILYILTVLLVLLVVQRLFVLQILNGDNYREISDSRLARNIPVKAPRGEILDRYGRAFITNRMGYTIAIAKIDGDTDKLNKVVFNLATLFDENSLTYQDTLPISKDAPFAFEFTGDDKEKKKQRKGI